MAEATVGIIGGSGLYEIEGLARVRSVCISTPFGDPSDAITLGVLEGVPVAFLPRHGIGHRISPTNIPSRANIYAFKTLGVERIISISAVGSLKEEIQPLDLVVPDQLIDRTRLRESTFFNQDVVAHVGFDQPFCGVLGDQLFHAAQAVAPRVHNGGTYVVMEGPAFSTKAESHLYRSWGASVIGMTALPEAKLAREAEICYATLACATDYDCWHESEEVVTVEIILANLMKNVANAKAILSRIIPSLTGSRQCLCEHALAKAVVTHREYVSESTKKGLWPIIGKYMA